MENITPVGDVVYTVINIERTDCTSDDLYIKLCAENFQPVWIGERYYPRKYMEHSFNDPEQTALFEGIKNDMKNRIVCAGNVTDALGSLLEIATGYRFCSADVVDVLSRLPTYFKVGNALFIVW